MEIKKDIYEANKDICSAEKIRDINKIKPNYPEMHSWELYSSAAIDEYRQCIDEGLDIEQYKDIFTAVAELPNGEIKEKFGDIIYEIVINAKQREDYKYIEPSELSNIKTLRKPYKDFAYDQATPLDDKILGAWMGRVCGCMLGKAVEGIQSKELDALLKATNNYPLNRYITKSDINSVDKSTYNYVFYNPCIDEVDGMPVDDDTNYTVMAYKIIEDYGKDFTPFNVTRIWLWNQSKDAYCTAERVAYHNFINGFEPPYSAVYKNPYREWIGAQIRADYYGYISPGNPEFAAEMAWRDASISHVKNGIYGAMFVAAMLAVAAVTNNIEDIILSGLAQVPCTSRLYEDVMSVLDGYKSGVSKEDCFKAIHEKYDESNWYGWCHTSANAMIVAAALLYGNSDYSKSICMAVETGFDTDCNGATVGSILGMANGIETIPECWTKPMNDTLYTALSGAGKVSISEMAKNTMKHIK